MRFSAPDSVFLDGVLSIFRSSYSSLVRERFGFNGKRFRPLHGWSNFSLYVSVISAASPVVRLAKSRPYAPFSDDTSDQMKLISQRGADGRPLHALASHRIG